MGKLLAVTPRGYKLFVPDDVPTDIAIARLQQYIVKGNKRRAEAFLKQEMDKLEKLQEHHLTGTD